MDTTLQIHVRADGYGDNRAELVAMLRNELLQLDVDEIRPLRGEQLPAGARAEWGIDLSGLAVVAETSFEMLSRLVGSLRAWRERADPRPAIRLEIDGDVVEISDVSAEQAEQALRFFVHRHADVRE
ncbi:hypothetical protein [Streptomonospora wellingtoniae]|uniref:IraD/Gp25-like domain-containing protein n=1 Tax=Streptomonospora wellingtoniae TaxID=3075544 RepID=A0ABU2KZ47_9ACTN|nr:hypothetical protein [Streptomonospora sp. DSM 45055]MDT0304298.1 hypothetical protein [Streptomonospora sp. DSM 45055]